MVKFSIIIPIYNGEKFIDRCLQSISAQTYKDFEVVLIDDGSQDTSLEKCSRWAAQDTRIKVFPKANGGVSSARNLGLSKAINEWVCFVDVDDELCPDYLESFFDGIACYNADMYICGFKVVHHKNQVIYEIGSSVYKSSQFLDLYTEYQPQGKFGIPWNKCFRKKIVDQHHLHFDIKTKRAEDELFNLQFLKYAQSVVCLPVITYVYNRYDVPTGGNKYQDFDERLYISEKLLNSALELQHDDYKAAIVKQMFIEKIVMAIREMYWAHNYCQFTSAQRYDMLKRVRQVVRKYKGIRYYHKVLKRLRLVFDNFCVMELLGFLLHLRNK